MSVPSQTPAQTKSAEAALKKEMASFTNAVSLVQDHQIILNGRKVRLRETEFPEKVFTNGVISGQAVSRLPAELQEMIWGHLPPVDRAALALASKSHASMYQQLKDIMVMREGLMVRRLPRPQRIDKALRLKILVRLKTWMPSTYRLCYSCGMYIKVKRADKQDGSWGGDKQLVVGGLATLKAIKEGPRCPLCVRRGHIEMAKHKQTWQEYKKLGQSITLKQTMPTKM